MMVALHKPVVVLGMGTANDGQRYNETPSIIGRAHT